MQSEPTEAYVYQPDPWPKGATDPAIFAVSGPGAEKLKGRRFTRGEALALAMRINADCDNQAAPGL